MGLQILWGGCIDVYVAEKGNVSDKIKNADS